MTFVAMVIAVISLLAWASTRDDLWGLSTICFGVLSFVV